MSNPYYLALDRTDELGFAQTNEALEPFRRYLTNAIAALKKKEVACRWQPLSGQAWRVDWVLQVYEITPITTIEMISSEEFWFRIILDLEESVALDEHFAGDFAEPVIIGKGAQLRKLTITNADLNWTGTEWHIHLQDMHDIERIQWSGYTLSIAPLGTPLTVDISLEWGGIGFKAEWLGENCIQIEGFRPASTPLKINGQVSQYRITHQFDPEQLSGKDTKAQGGTILCITDQKLSLTNARVTEITQQWLTDQRADLFISNKQRLDPALWRYSVVAKQNLIKIELEQEPATTHKENHKVSAPDKLANLLQLAEFANTMVSCVPAVAEEKWLQLIEIDDGQSDNSGLSNLDYFFDDTISIRNASDKSRDENYRVIQSRPDERQILLAEGKSPRKSVYPTEDRLKVNVDTSQLYNQQKAIQNLKDMPMLDHEPLLRLFDDYDAARWQTVQPIPEHEITWKILTDRSFDGCDRQREFVCKALATDDFAILDGPPGTGKTTTILELVLQLARKGQRVLLCASTHAAINNVLERIGAKNLGHEIFAMKIGDKNRAAGVEEFQYDSVHADLNAKTGINISEQILVDSANLVCGTTMGILRLFKNDAVNLSTGIAPFDVLIIDECSKTTFQEFLVPARFAKRWVLVGDVRQLSPFTDREQITANLDQLLLFNRVTRTETRLEPALQKACFYLSSFTPYREKYIVPVHASVLLKLDEELAARTKQDFEKRTLQSIGLFGTSARNSDFWFSPDQLNDMPELFYRRNFWFMDESLLGTYQVQLPVDVIVLDQQWTAQAHGFRHRASPWVDKHYYRDRKTQLTNAFEIHRALRDLDKKNWSGEVCWRLEREYWLRLLKQPQKVQHIESELKRLFPKSVEADGKIYQIRNIAFPSILEALSGNGLQKRRADRATTLNQGFAPHIKRCRYTTLTYQHRMHPDISQFPREQFYTNAGEPSSLLNGAYVAAHRQWSYSGYPKRSHWIDVQGKVFSNRNKDEVEVIMRELKRFGLWAKDQLNDEGRRFDVAILTFYKGQETALRESLQDLCKNKNAYSHFEYCGLSIRLATVDYFQGQEADMVMLSMVNTSRDGFMDSPNRLNVSITRARYQLLIVGHQDYFAHKSKTAELNALAKQNAAPH